MALNIKIENFEGPFDLLLHLIKKNEMNIYEIKIAEITEQYLDYLKSMKEMDLEIASEFIVIASALLEIKSKELLPKIKEENHEEIDEEDIKKQLIEKLIQYRRFKQAAGLLRKQESSSGTSFSKKPEGIEENKDFDINEVLKNVDMLKLYNIFSELMFIYLNKMNAENKISKKITVDVFKIEDKMEEIKEYLYSVKKSKFSVLVNNCSEKMEIIVTFLAMLELIKQKNLRILQEDNFAEIYVENIV